MIVTVAFDVLDMPNLPQITIPMAGAEYVRYPVQIGDKGFTTAADVYMGGVSGIGTAQSANNGNTGNLSSVLVFVPASSTKWSKAENHNAVIVYGPDGVIIRDTKKSATITLKPGSIMLQVGSTMITLTAGGITSRGNWTHQGTITTTGDVRAGAISVDNHVHVGVQSGNSNTGKPI